MTWSFSIGRLFGSELRVHATFFLLLVWIGTAAWLSGGPAAAAENVLFLVALFACVVAHEFGHALTARRYGIRTPDITLLPIGGLARLERIPEDPRQEIAVAVAGPLVNVAIWGALALVIGVETDLRALGALEEVEQGFFSRLAAVNLFLAVFNMVPAFPMDGGRVLRAALTIPLGRLRATRIAARAGQALAFAFGFIGLATNSPVLVLIAVFVFIAALAERSDVEMHTLAQGYRARDVMITSYEHLAPDAPLHAAASALLRTTQSEFPVVDADGRLAGFLTRSRIVEAAQGDGLAGAVASRMTAGAPAVALESPLGEVLDDLQRADVPAVAVNDRRGRFLRYVTRENVGEWAFLHRRDGRPRR